MSYEQHIGLKIGDRVVAMLGGMVGDRGVIEGFIEAQWSLTGRARVQLRRTDGTLVEHDLESCRKDQLN